MPLLLTYIFSRKVIDEFEHERTADAGFAPDERNGSLNVYSLQEQPEVKEPPLALSGAADHWSHRADDDDYYSQPRDLFQLMSPAQQQMLFENTARAMGDAPEEIKLRHIGNCTKADPAYGAGVAKALGLS